MLGQGAFRFGDWWGTEKWMDGFGGCRMNLKVKRWDMRPWVYGSELGYDSKNRKETRYGGKVDLIKCGGRNKWFLASIFQYWYPWQVTARMTFCTVVCWLDHLREACFCNKPSCDCSRCCMSMAGLSHEVSIAKCTYHRSSALCFELLKLYVTWIFAFFCFI